MTGLGSAPGSGWFADPLGHRGDLRWWDGRAWTARTVPDGAGGESISWSLALGGLGAPEAAPAAEAPLAEPAAPPRPLVDAPTDATPLAELAARSEPAAVQVPAGTVPAISFRALDVAPPVPVAPEALHPLDVGVDDELSPAEAAATPVLPRPAEHVAEPEVARAPGRARRRFVAALAAAAVVGIAAGAGAGIVDGDDRPVVEPAIEYRDADAGFALRYPDTWDVQRRSSGESVQFTIADPGASGLRTNLVTVRVGAEPADGESGSLPSLDELASEVTTRLREEHPGIELEAAGRTQLADAPALHLALVDADEVPPIRIQQYAGRTTTGRPLTVSITVREPRTAPTPQQLRDFIASIAPA